MTLRAKWARVVDRVCAKEDGPGLGAGVRVHAAGQERQEHQPIAATGDLGGLGVQGGVAPVRRQVPAELVPEPPQGHARRIADGQVEILPRQGVAGRW